MLAERGGGCEGPASFLSCSETCGTERNISRGSALGVVLPRLTGMSLEVAWRVYLRAPQQRGIWLAVRAFISSPRREHEERDMGSCCRLRASAHKNKCRDCSWSCFPNG